MSSIEVFERFAEKYDTWYRKNTITAHNELRIIKCMIKGRPRPCVEIGSGSGYFTREVGCDLGIDPSLSMLRIARGRGVESVAAVGEDIPLKDKSVGTVLMIVTLCFLDNPMRVLSEIRRIVRQDGLFIVCIVPRESWWSRFYLRLSIAGNPFYKVARFYFVNEMVDLVKNFGFRYIRSLATLGYRPWNRPRPERPKSFEGKEGFVCVEFGG